VLGSHTIPAGDGNPFSSFAIQKGRFCIWKVGEKRTTGWDLHDVFNAFALLALLKFIFRPEEPVATK
jgi:hypothetical protein